MEKYKFFCVRSRMMKKILLLALSTALLFASCSSAPEAEPQQEQEPVAQTVVEETKPVQEAVTQVVEETIPQEQEKVEEILEEVFQNHRQTLVLEGAKEYKVQYGDTLSKIANKFYGKGNGYYFPIIMLASADTVQDPDTIEPGMVLTIPDLNKNLKETSVHPKLKEFFTEIADVYKNKKTASAPTIRRELQKIAQSL